MRSNVLCRAKVKDENDPKNGEWVTGFYVPIHDWCDRHSYRIYTGYAKTPLGIYFEPERYEVDPETVGQYTGSDDKNVKKIFDGDVVKCVDKMLPYDDPYRTFVGIVKYKYNSFCIDDGVCTHYRWIDYKIEIIGNIYDNPELLEVNRE